MCEVPYIDVINRAAYPGEIKQHVKWTSHKTNNEKIFTSPMSWPVLMPSLKVSTKVAASPKPRLTPWPASGWTVWAASPTRATLLDTYLVACLRDNGKESRSERHAVTGGGAINGSDTEGGISPNNGVNHLELKGPPIRELGRGPKSSVSARLTAVTKSSFDIAFSSLAFSGVVDHTILLISSPTGSRARGPVGRNLCQAVEWWYPTRTVQINACWL